MPSFDRAIPPGGAGQITLRVDTTNFQGRITKNARIVSNDPKQRETKIYLTIEVRPLIVVEPAPRVTLQGVVGDDIRQVLRIRSGDDHPLEITKVETDLGSSIDYKLSRKEGGNPYEIEVVSKVAGQEVANGFLRLYTSHPGKKELRLPVYLRIRPELEIWPRRVAFNRISRTPNQNREFRQVVTIVNNRGKEFRIRELHYNKEYFRVSPMEPTDRSPRRYQLEIFPLLDRIPAGRVGVKDTLIIRTDSVHGGELKVPMIIKLEDTAGGDK